MMLGAALAGPPEAVSSLLAEMAAANAALRDATYTVEISEWTDGAQQPPQSVSVRYRRPEALWLRWIGEAHPGRQVLYRQGWNSGQLRVRPAPYLPLLNLDPTGAIAMRGSRHPVWMISLSRIVDRILGVMAILDARPELEAQYTDEGTVTEGGEPSRCYQAVLPYDQEPALYAPKVRVCGSVAHRLPTRFSAWKAEGGAIRLVEDYRFRDLVVNPGLTEADFDPDRL